MRAIEIRRAAAGWLYAADLERPDHATTLTDDELAEVNRRLRVEHAIVYGGAHDATCLTDGWWAEASGVALEHYVMRHHGRQPPPCDLECCEAVVPTWSR